MPGSDKKRTHTPDVELDARLVLASMRGGIDRFLATAMARRDIFDGPDAALDRAAWLKRQSKAYIKKVSDRAAEIESAGG